MLPRTTKERLSFPCFEQVKNFFPNLLYLLKENLPPIKKSVCTSPYLPHLPPHFDESFCTLGRHVAIKFCIPINTSVLNLWLQAAAHAVPRTWRLMNIIALLRGEAQIITYDTLYVQRFMTQPGQAYICVGFSPSYGAHLRCWEEVGDFYAEGSTVGGRRIIDDVWVNGIVQTIDMLNRRRNGKKRWWCWFFCSRVKIKLVIKLLQKLHFGFDVYYYPLTGHTFEPNASKQSFVKFLKLWRCGTF